MKGILQNKKGSALLNVLLVLLMLGIIGGGLLTVTANNTRQAALLKTYEGNYYNAEAAVNAGVDAVKTATSKEYARLLANAITNPSNPEYKTITNQTFFGNIRSSALQMLSSEYQSIVSIALPSSYSGTSGKEECVYTITATVSDGVLSRTAKATIASYKMPLASGGGGQYADAPLIVAQNLTVNKSVIIPTGSIYLNKDASVNMNGTITVNNGSINEIAFNKTIWPMGIINAAYNNRNSLPPNMHYCSSDPKFSEGVNYDNQIYFVDGYVDFNKGGHYQLNNTMIFCEGIHINGDIIVDPNEYFFLYVEGNSFDVNSRVANFNVIAYANKCGSFSNNANDIQYNGQLISDSNWTNLNNKDVTFNFNSAAKAAAANFYSKIASWSFVGNCKPNFDNIEAMGIGVGGGGGVPTIPAEDMTGKQSKITQE